MCTSVTPKLAPAFKVLSTHVLRGLKAASVYAVIRNSSGHFFATDTPQGVVREYDADGKFVRTIGSPGATPGKFTTPFAIACDDSDRLYVLDLRQSRVHIFGTAGKFLGSVSFAARGFSGISLAVNHSGAVLVGGFPHYQIQSEPPIIHELSTSGDEQAAFFRVSPLVNSLNLRVVAGVEMSVARDDSVFAVQPIDPHIYHFSPRGLLLQTIGAAPPFYRKPVRFPSEMPKDRAEVSRLLARWTQLDGVNVLSDGRLLVTYWVHCPVEYVVSVYRIADGVLAYSGSSEFLPLFTDSLGYVYCRRAPTMEGPGDDMSIIQCALRG
jgi:hypothetical protein